MVDECHTKIVHAPPIFEVATAPAAEVVLEEPQGIEEAEEDAVDVHVETVHAPPTVQVATALESPQGIDDADDEDEDGIDEDIDSTGEDEDGIDEDIDSTGEGDEHECSVFRECKQCFNNAEWTGCGKEEPSMCSTF